MDTRVKILPTEQAVGRIRELVRDGVVLRVFTGYFDVLGADHVRQLRSSINGSVRPVVFVIVLPSANPILTLEARAELVAALAMVDYVVIAGEEADFEAVLTAAGSEILRTETGDAQRTRQLIEHVHQRQLQQAP